MSTIQLADQETTHQYSSLMILRLAFIGILLPLMFKHELLDPSLTEFSASWRQFGDMGFGQRPTFSGKGSAYHAGVAEVGGEELLRSLLDDMDSRVGYYTSAFLPKRMLTKVPGKYQRMLHNLVFKAQQSNNAKLLENPYLQMRGRPQLSSECDSPSFQSES
ncbi:hypothetical protein R1sor_013547 [Riccia sorocarpa]|uniref:Uncharacterized protein n=1 Tax=Riccia sorocarpa TaxID=122646 RepID=A0ABD3H6Z6_9MARC